MLAALVVVALSAWAIRSMSGPGGRVPGASGGPPPGWPGTVLNPGVRAVIPVGDDAVRTLEARLAPGGRSPLPTLTHALHLFGRDVEVAGRDGEPVKVLDLLLDSDRGFEYFGTRHLVSTRYGARFPVHVQLLLGTSQTGAESHQGQALSVLGEMGVPLDSPIRLPGGGAGTLRLVLDDLIANFTLEGEIYWDAASIGLYVPPARSWTDKFGRRFTFDELAQELLSRDPGDSSCAGTHRLSTLVLLLRTDAATPIFSDRVRDEVRGHLGLVARVLAECQASDGSWDLDWHANLPGAKHGHKEPGGAWSKIITTGHHLEWMMLLGPDLRPRDEVFARGAQWLMPTLLREVGERGPLGPQYCPASHAVRVLRILGRPGPVDRGLIARSDVDRAGKRDSGVTETVAKGGR